jgi:hypothetical protein
MRVPCGLGFPAFRRKRCSFHRLFSNNDWTLHVCQ